MSKTKTFHVGQTVQVWDYLGVDENHCTKDDALPGHGLIGVIVRASTPEDVVEGYCLGERSEGCYFVAVPGTSPTHKSLSHYNVAWLREVVGIASNAERRIACDA